MSDFDFMPTCSECIHGTIGLHSAEDKCAHANNTNGFPPYALRHDETLCGSAAAWFSEKPLKSIIYKADEAMGVKAAPIGVKEPPP